MPADASYTTLFFEELTGDKRRVFLRGSEAPQGHPRASAAFDLGGDVRRTVEYDPGVQTPSVSISGTRERNLVVRIHFRDQLTGIDGQALQRKSLIDSIRREARPLRIVWGADIRRGILADAKFGIEGPRDITAELTFELYDQGTNSWQGRRVITPLSLPTTLSDIEDTIASAKTSLQVPGLSIDVASGLNELFGAVLNPLGALLAIGEDLEAGIGDTVGAFTSAANSLKRLQQRLENLLGHLSSLTASIDTEDAAAIAAFEAARIAALAELARAADLCADTGAVVEAKAQKSTPKRAMVVRQGDTLEQIAANAGKSVAEIVRMNPGLTGGVPPAGLTLKI